MTEVADNHIDKKIIFFDGVCNLCNDSVQYIIRHDKNNQFYFSALQSDTAKQMLDNLGPDSKSVILFEKGKTYFKSTAALRIARHLSGIHQLLYVFIIVPRFIRDFFYDIIARNRYKWFGKKNECMIPTPELQSKFV